jgi:hypothetical protein
VIEQLPLRVRNRFPAVSRAVGTKAVDKRLMDRLRTGLSEGWQPETMARNLSEAYKARCALMARHLHLDAHTLHMHEPAYVLYVRCYVLF